MAAAASMFLLIFFLIITPKIHSQNTNVNEFIYKGFNNTDLRLRLFGESTVKSNGLLMLTNMANNVIGRAFYPQPIQMFHNNDVSKPFSFSTYFVFSIVPPANAKGGYGIAFVISPSTEFPGAQDEHYLGIFNSYNTSSMSGQQNNVLAVEFDTVNGHNENFDSAGNHVGINLNNITSLATRSAAYFIDEARQEDFQMEEEPAVQAWIGYDGVAEILSVTIAKMNISKPSKPLLSHSIKSSYFQKSMYMGFSASTGRKASSHYIIGWSFRINGTAQAIDTSQLPDAPPRDVTMPSSSSSYTPRILALIGSLSALVIGLLLENI